MLDTFIMEDVEVEWDISWHHHRSTRDRTRIQLENDWTTPVEKKQTQSGLCDHEDSAQLAAPAALGSGDP